MCISGTCGKRRVLLSLVYHTEFSDRKQPAKGGPVMMHPYWQLLRSLLLTMAMVTCLSYHLLISYVTKLQAANEGVLAGAGALRCACGEGCVSLLMGPREGVVYVPLEKYRWQGGVCKEIAVNFVVNLLVGAFVSVIADLLY
ncbi:hypothetical protein KFL_000670130 [Klebsormidium nitens]|uniref:Uncharacterized protein n=1 Tax=Klebsormidium nitens TaxID=105231 RepID=A0A1Y1HQP3_KLENI|nr:hypothetical protein KFL_000670130 [Klebsormidium nitens]|eukprot:GAQ80955.1 hypothetical protein KFL_000670130 [Klebsormidium nitens]